MNDAISLQARYRGALLGLAAGDAVGTTLEFKPPGSFAPITDMIGGGPFGLKPGEWTDDTSMALCLADSLIQCRGFSPSHQLYRYSQWKNKGLYSVKGFCFDIGGTTSRAIRRFDDGLRRGERLDELQYCGSVDPNTAGNGSLMRLAPVVLAYAHDTEKAIDFAGKSSMTTHAAPECVAACRFFAGLILKALRGNPKEVILNSNGNFVDTPAVAKIALGSYKRKMPVSFVPRPKSECIRGTGFVLDCLEASLWSFYTTSNFRDAVLAAANLGDDADTTAAVTGQLAGAYYGEDGIPAEWREKLAWRYKFEEFADSLLEMSRENASETAISENL